MKELNSDLLREAADTVTRRLGAFRPHTAVILGSGWGGAMDAFNERDGLTYSNIPGLGATGVEGHSGRLAVMEGGQRSFLAFHGRRHAYEGVGWTPIAIPVHLARSLGVRTLVLTNAAGGMRPGMVAGDLMAISDHINAMGDNPLIGPHDPLWGPRFPDQSAVYDATLRGLLQAAATTADIAVSEGVYLAARGPVYETPAEVRTYRQWGADAVGMSTVPEAILGHAAGLRVVGLSCITNLAAGLSSKALSHQEVIEVTRQSKGRMSGLLETFLRRIDEDASTTP